MAAVILLIAQHNQPIVRDLPKHKQQKKHASRGSKKLSATCQPADDRGQSTAYSAGENCKNRSPLKYGIDAIIEQESDNSEDNRPQRRKRGQKKQTCSDQHSRLNGSLPAAQFTLRQRPVSGSDHLAVKTPLLQAVECCPATGKRENPGDNQ